MKLLLDTCACLWAIHAPERLSAKAREAIETPAHSVHVSVITFWEISLKTGLGKLRFEGVTPEDYPSLAAQSGWVIHPVEASVAASFDQLPPVPEHRDPFDRLLIWTAIREGFTLVTADRTFAGYAPHGLRICW